MEKKQNIVATESKAYGYNYASLSDIAKQGFTIPKMKTATDTNGKDYVYYYDTELKEWIRGSEIIIPEMKGMNASQKYGAGITFARRYTCHLALQLACDDDKKVETQEPTSKKTEIFDVPIYENMTVKELSDLFRQRFTEKNQEEILKKYNYQKAEDLGTKNLIKYLRFADEKAQANQS